jgi:predicted Zn finger-like uncharacterized protein
MFTVCPKCALTLVVTAADLRVAQGYVRCGRCSSVFNALARLTDERQAAALQQSQEPAADEPAEPPPDSTQSGTRTGDDDDLTDDALEFDPTRTDASAVFVEPPPNPQWTAATGSFKALVAGQEPRSEPPSDGQVDVEIDADFLASMLQDSPEIAPEGATNSTPDTRPPAATEPPARPPGSSPRQVAQPSAGTSALPRRAATGGTESAAPAAPARRSAARAVSSVTSGGAAAARAAPTAVRPAPQTRHVAPHTRPQAATAVARPSRTPAEPDDTAADAVELTGENAVRAAGERPLARILRSTSPRTWMVGTVIAALLLVAQIINHHRDELAASTRFNRPLTALYSAFGVQLTPRWDLHAYDVRQLGASVDPAGGGLITVRASIKNSASQAQPLPLLRVTLQDRFGNRIAARDVAPRFYVPHSMPPSSFLSGGQRIDAEMGFVDPGANAVGFEIDACLPASGGGVTCANDTNTR